MCWNLTGKPLPSITTYPRTVQEFVWQITPKYIAGICPFSAGFAASDRPLEGNSSRGALIRRPNLPSRTAPGPLRGNDFLVGLSRSGDALRWTTEISTLSRLTTACQAASLPGLLLHHALGEGFDSEYTAAVDRLSLDLQFQEFQRPSPILHRISDTASLLWQIVRPSPTLP
ncbi:uncharacterized protein BDW70DRAFT_45 [Aspergillus foveolatus]|uniref:uncharacterized protein n=1 Tax=Aspergillus foveolatus TaxID=210207 RepID=UPI003CCE3CA7